MDHKFVVNVLLVTSCLAIFCFSFLSVYTNYFDSLGIVLGAAWGCLNFYFLAQILQKWLKVESRTGLKLYALAAIKFPLLYWMGYILMKMDFFPILNIVWGFSLLFLAIFLLGLKLCLFDQGVEKKGTTPL